MMLGTAQAADCPSFTDAKGDSIGQIPVANQAVPVLTDPALDIVLGSVTSDSTTLTGLVKVDKAAATPAFAPGNYFEFGFKTANGKTVQIFSERYPEPVNGAVRQLPSELFVFEGIKVNGDNGVYPVTAKTDTATNTISLSVKLADLDKAVGAATAGTTLTAFTAATQGAYVAANSNYDSAKAPDALSYRVGAVCTPAAGAAPEPSAAPSEEPSEEPSAEPSESPTEEPSGEPSESSTPLPGQSFGPSSKASLHASRTTIDAGQSIRLDGRLTRPDGSPLARQQVHLRAHTGQTTQDEQIADEVTDDNGVFFLDGVRPIRGPGAPGAKVALQSRTGSTHQIIATGIVRQDGAFEIRRYNNTPLPPGTYTLQVTIGPASGNSAGASDEFILYVR
ncbi:MAG: hypothetical protein LC640_12780 [Frankia sp.]|nr:hypothetical protein [Frankia sp.]